MLSLYVPGSSLVHRAPAWLKLIALVVIGTGVMIVTWWPVLVAVLLVIAAGYILARPPWRVLGPLMRAMLILVAIVAACQWLFSGSMTMTAVVSLRLLCLIMAANLLTWTTRVADLVATLDALLRPLARLGLRTDKFSLAVALALRFIPVIAEQGRLIREAQRARGVKAPLTYLAPLIIRTIRMADGVGDALESRGANRRLTASTPAPAPAKNER